MNKCNQCKVHIQDDVSLCPLCKCVLEQTGSGDNTYPNIRIIAKRHHLWLRIYVFLAFMIESLLLYLNYVTYDGSLWSVVTGVVLVYAFIALALSFKDDVTYAFKTIMLIMTAILGIILIDVLTGFDGWSLTYFLPGGIMLLNTGIVVAMLINMRNWQRYMMVELMTILWSLVPFIFQRMGLLSHMTESLVACAYSVFLFAGTVIIGGKRASAELRRRFHVR